MAFSVHVVSALMLVYASIFVFVSVPEISPRLEGRCLFRPGRGVSSLRFGVILVVGFVNLTLPSHRYKSSGMNYVGVVPFSQG